MESYFRKYIKYKNKYLSAKQQVGRGIDTLLPEEILTKPELLNYIEYDSKTRNCILRSIPITSDSSDGSISIHQWTVTDKTDSQGSVIDIRRTVSSDQMIIIQIKDMNRKTLAIKSITKTPVPTNININLYANISDLDPKNYINNVSGKWEFLISHMDPPVKFKGICDIIGSNITNLRVEILGINNVNFNFTDRYNSINEIVEMFDDSKSMKYDYENEYDKFKSANYEKVCKESQIVLKALYSSIYNTLYVKTHGYLSELAPKYGPLIVRLIQREFESMNTGLKKICSDPKYRSDFLRNVMKRIEATNDNVMIKDHRSDKFMKIPPQFNVVFDTGNSSITLIGENIVKYFNLPINKQAFKFKTSGVGGMSVNDLGYVEIILSIDKGRPYAIDEEYKIIAYVNDKNLKDTLLLGQASSGLRDFFRRNYCIGYNYDKSSARYVDIEKQIKDAYQINNDLTLIVTSLNGDYSAQSLLSYIKIKINELQGMISYISSNKALVTELYTKLVYIREKLTSNDWNTVHNLIQMIDDMII